MLSWFWRTLTILISANEKTSKTLGKLASKVLRSTSSTKTAKSLAGSVLPKRPDKRK
jgi:hypothetical protein